MTETVISVGPLTVLHMEEMLSTAKHILYCTADALYDLNLVTNHPQPVLISGSTIRGYKEGKGEWEENYGSMIKSV